MSQEVSNKTLVVLGTLVIVFFAITSLLVWSSLETTNSGDKPVQVTGASTGAIVQNAVLYVEVVDETQEGGNTNG